MTIRLPLLSLLIASLAFLVVFASPSQAEAQRHPGSLGIGIGTTTLASGLSLKQVTGPTALQLTAGCWRGCDGVSASLDLLTNMSPLIAGNEFFIAWNVGAGAAAGVADDTLGLAGSFVVGLELIFSSIPFDFVAEWRPSLLVLPDANFDIATFGGHIRFCP